jgi:hypothetical protein
MTSETNAQLFIIGLVASKMNGMTGLIMGRLSWVMVTFVLLVLLAWHF